MVPVRHLLALLLLSLFLLSMLPNSTSVPTYSYGFCSNATIEPNSKYQTNLNTVFQSLTYRSNATNNPDSFFSTAAGNNPTYTMYGLFLCRGDQNASSCSDCVATATTTDMPGKCPNRVHAVLWYDQCMVRYSNMPLAGIMDVNPGISLRNKINVTGSQAGFPEILEKIMDNVVVQTVKNTSGKKFFAMSVASFANSSQSSPLYALAQCTPDLTSFDCNRCLTTAVGQLEVSDSGRVLQPSCNVRYATFPIFSSSTPPSPTPAPAPAPVPATTLAPDNPIGSPSPGSSRASGKMTLPHPSILVGFGNLLILNLYYQII